MAIFALATQAVAIAQKVQQVLGEVNTLLSRGVVLHIENQTSLPLALTFKEHQSGDFSEPPDNTIPAQHAAVFGSKGSLLLGPAAAGRVKYRAQGIDLDYHVSWEVPIIGDNAGSGRCDGGAREYFDTAASVGAFAASIAKHELSFRPLQRGWRRCARCATLNHQTGGLDAACVTGTTHDNSVSQNYAVIASGLLGVTPFVAKRCTKCECLVTVFAPVGACAAGGLHDTSDPAFYTIVSHPNAPGESGWLGCIKCSGLIVDSSRPCPGGGVHVPVPAPVFAFWS